MALAWALGIALLAWMTRNLEWRHLAASVRSAPGWAWATTVLGLLGSYVLRALRIHAELGARHGLSVTQCLGVMLIHNSAVNLLPMRGGEAAYPWLMNRRLGVPLGTAAASLVWMRLQDAFVLAVLVLAVWPGIPPPLRALAIGGAVLCLVAGLRVLDRLSTGLAERGPKRLRVLQRPLQALALAPKHGVRGWIYCCSSWTVKLLALGVLLASLSGLPLAAAMTGALGGELSAVLPLQGPANLGTYEAGVYVAASLRGSPGPGVVVAAVAVHALTLATAVLSGAMAYAVSGGRRAAPSSTSRTPWTR